MQSHAGEAPSAVMLVIGNGGPHAFSPTRSPHKAQEQEDDVPVHAGILGEERVLRMGGTQRQHDRCVCHSHSDPVGPFPVAISTYAAMNTATAMQASMPTVVLRECGQPLPVTDQPARTPAINVSVTAGTTTVT